MSHLSTPVMEPELRNEQKILPPFHIIIENDDYHTMGFVVEVLQKTFAHPEMVAIELMAIAHTTGQAVVWTGAKEIGELKLEQLLTHREKHYLTGADLGPLKARLEPAA